MSTELTFDRLVGAIEDVHSQLSRQAKAAVNMSLTLRNWLIGAYIGEYELRGADRAAYGAELLPRLSVSLRELGVRGADRRQLYCYLSFYRTYPELVRTLTAQSAAPALAGIVRTLSAQSAAPALGALAEKRDTATPESARLGDRLLQALSYSHFEQLVRLDDPDKRRFHEQRCIQATWSVRELKRQIASLYYERTALSLDKEALHARTEAVAEQEAPALDIRDPYVFELLGLRPAEVMGESELEDALLDKLQAFLLELGHGFCFEARRRRILLGDTHGFVDLVFYHRILKCHVLVELKVGAFTHEHIGYQVALPTEAEIEGMLAEVLA